MARNTEYLGLYLPEESEFYNVEKDQNENFEKIDRKIKELDTFEKKTGYNLDKTDDYNLDNTNLLGTAKALKTLYDALNKKLEVWIYALIRLEMFMLQLIQLIQLTYGVVRFGLN